MSFFPSCNLTEHPPLTCKHGSYRLSNRQFQTVKKVLCHAQYSLSAVKPQIAVVKSVQKCVDRHLTSHFLHFLCRKETVKFKS